MKRKNQCKSSGKVKFRDVGMSKWSSFGLTGLEAVLCIMLSAGSACGQFTYVGVDFGYNRTAISTSQFYEYDNNVINSSYLSLQAMRLPLKFLAVGLSYQIPLKQTGTGSFRGAPVTYEYAYGGFSGFNESRYVPQSFSYEFSRSHTLTLQSRLIAHEWWGLFIEGRMSFFSITERFVLSRNALSEEYFGNGNLRYPALPAVRINEDIKHSVVAPGLAAGFMPQWESSFFVQWIFGFDVVSLGPGSSFTHEVPYRRSDSFTSSDYVSFRSAATNSHWAWFTSLGIGFYF